MTNIGLKLSYIRIVINFALCYALLNRSIFVCNVISNNNINVFMLYIYLPKSSSLLPKNLTKIILHVKAKWQICTQCVCVSTSRNETHYIKSLLRCCPREPAQCTRISSNHLAMMMHARGNIFFHKLDMFSCQLCETSSRHIHTRTQKLVHNTKAGKRGSVWCILA